MRQKSLFFFTYIESILSISSLTGEIRMAFVLYRNLGSYLPTENASVRLSSEAVYPNYSVIVNSPVITASINKESNKVYLSEPVVFTVQHLQVSGGFISRIKKKKKRYQKRTSLEGLSDQIYFPAVVLHKEKEKFFFFPLPGYLSRNTAFHICHPWIFITRGFNIFFKITATWIKIGHLFKVGCFKMGFFFVYLGFFCL